MIDCDVCTDSIGSTENPIFVTSDGETVCRECYIEIEGCEPDEDEGQVIE